MEDLARILFNGETEDKIQAAIDISKLKMINQLNMLVESGGIIIPLVLMIRSQDYNSIEAALSALISIARGSERNKFRIAKSGTIPVLIGLLKDGSGSLIQLAVVALLTLSSCTTNKSAIASSGVVPVLVEFLSREDDSRYDFYQAKLDAIDILHNLSASRRVVFSIVSAGTVSILVQLIANSDKSSKIVEKAIGLLETIVSSSEIGLAQIDAVEGGILALVETIEDASQQKSREHAVEVLFLICKSCREKYRELILNEGAIPGLLQLCVDGTWRSKDTARDLLLLLRETSNNGSRKRQLRNRFLEQIMNGIDSDEEKVAEKTMRMVEKMIMAV